MPNGKFWTVKIAKDKIQDYYDDLARLFNDSKIAQIGKLYNDMAVICARKSRLVFRGPQGAVEFWTWVKKVQKVKKIGFKVRRVVLGKAHEFVQLGPNRFAESIQRFSYFGRMKYVLRENDPDGDFGGDGGHMFICDREGRNEDYEF